MPANTNDGNMRGKVYYVTENDDDWGEITELEVAQRGPRYEYLRMEIIASGMSTGAYDSVISCYRVFRSGVDDRGFVGLHLLMAASPMPLKAQQRRRPYYLQIQNCSNMPLS